MSTASPLFPYYGSAEADARITPALVLNLLNRGPGVCLRNPCMHVIDGPGRCIYYAYPEAYGEAIFKNLADNMRVGWDGAHRGGVAVTGPTLLDIMFGSVAVPFYVYQTTVPNMSPQGATIFWEVS